MNYYKVSPGRTSAASAPKLAIECPHCGKSGTFDIIIGNDIAIETTYFGQRKCPNPDCLGHVFFIMPNDKTLDLTIYPPTTITFSKSGIPDKVLLAFEEAVICHSVQCYVASAILLRKTLEEICSDKGAKGDNLYKKLESLASIIIVPQQLISATQDLRLLGNDAAHLESQTYNEIGKQEIEISIEFTKEILKAVYQYDGLLAKLRSLKRS